MQQKAHEGVAALRNSTVRCFSESNGLLPREFELDTGTDNGFLFSPDAKTIEKVGKICYNGISCGADKTKSKETEVIGFAAFVIAIVVIISLPECRFRFNRIGETDNGYSYRTD